MSGFQTYLIGFIILIVGLALAAYLLGLPATWIAVGLIVLIGLGIMAATRYSDADPPSRPPEY
jgi:positive regulator of sigma E activity